MNKFLKNACFAIAIACGCVGVIGSCISTADVLGMKSKKSDNETLCREISESFVNAVFDVYSRKKDNALEDWFISHVKTYAQEDIGEFAKLLKHECLEGRIRDLFDLTLQADHSLREQYVLAMSRFVVALYAAGCYRWRFEMAQDIFAMVHDFLEKFTSSEVKDFDRFIESHLQYNMQAAEFLIHCRENKELACVRDTVNSILGKLIEKQRLDCDRQSALQAFDKDLRGKLLATDSLSQMKVVQAQDSVVRRKESSDKVTAASKKIAYAVALTLLAECGIGTEQSILPMPGELEVFIELFQDLHGTYAEGLSDSIMEGNRTKALEAIKSMVSRTLRSSRFQNLKHEEQKIQKSVIDILTKQGLIPQRSFVSLKSRDGCEKYMEEIKLENGNVLCFYPSKNLIVELCSGDYATERSVQSRRAKKVEEKVLALRPIDVIVLLEVVGDEAKKAFDAALQTGDVTGVEACLKKYEALSMDIERRQYNIAQKSDLLTLARGVVSYIEKVANKVSSESNDNPVKINTIDLNAYIQYLNGLIKEVESNSHGSIEHLVNSLADILFRISTPNEKTIDKITSCANLAFHTEVQLLVLLNLVPEGVNRDIVVVSLLNPCHSCATLSNVLRAKDRETFLFVFPDSGYIKEVTRQMTNKAEQMTKDGAKPINKKKTEQMDGKESSGRIKNIISQAANLARTKRIRPWKGLSNNAEEDCKHIDKSKKK